jgi:hypothetical protein
MIEPYLWMEIKPLPRDWQIPDTPDADETNIYGKVLIRWGNMRLRHAGGVWSVWAGARLIFTTREVWRVVRFVR